MSDRSKAVEKRLKRQAAIRQKVERALKDTEGAFTNIGVEKDPFDLPDIKAERVGQKRAASLAMLNNRWPELPSAKVSFELHVPEIAEVHIAEFEAALELAVAIDVVANKMLRSRESYNAYLQEFDNYIADCASNIKKHLTELKNLSKDEMLSSERPAKTLFKIGTLRGMQIHSCYAEADTALRHGCYAMIFQTITQQEYVSRREEIVKALHRMKTGLRRVKQECFQEIARQDRMSAFNGTSNELVTEERIDPHARINEQIVRDLVTLKEVSKKRRSNARRNSAAHAKTVQPAAPEQQAATPGE